MGEKNENETKKERSNQRGSSMIGKVFMKCVEGSSCKVGQCFCPLHQVNYGELSEAYTHTHTHIYEQKNWVSCSQQNIGSTYFGVESIFGKEGIMFRENASVR